MYILKSGMLGRHKLGAIIKVQHLATKLHDGCACPTVLLKLTLVPYL